MKHAAVIFAVTLATYVYFFQGDGWSHQANYCTIRSLVERGTFEITPLRHLTGDLSIVEGRVYSNKPPGLPLLGAPVYLVLTAVERAAGLEIGLGRIDLFNQAILTAWLCALPGAAIAAMIHLCLRRRGASPPAAAALALVFAFGSIVWPYSITLFNHVLTAALLLGAWLLISSAGGSTWRIVLAGALLALATLCDYLAGPVSLIFIGYDAIVRRCVARFAILGGGLAIGVAGLLFYHHAVFGNALSTSYAFEAGQTRGAEAEAPRFAAPDWRRVYWITWHRMRGLFYCSPIFALALAAPLLARRRPDGEQVVAILVIGFYLAFYLTYRYYLGGWGVGPRFAIPALPFVFLFVLRPAMRFPRTAALLAGISIVNMLAVTAVNVIVEGNESGEPQHWDPVGTSLLNLLHGQISAEPNSYNLGLLLGLRGAWSLLPPAVGVAGAFVWALRRRPEA